MLLRYEYHTVQVEEPPPTDKKEEGKGDEQPADQPNGPKADGQQSQQQSSEKPSEPMDVD